MVATIVKSIREQLAEAGATLDDVSYFGTAAVPSKESKWRNLPVDDPADGHFDSMLEYRTWIDLKRRAQAGEITALRRQVTYRLVVGGVHVCSYRADFAFVEGEDGTEVVADAKGKATVEYIIKYKLMLAVYGIRIREYTKHGIAPPRTVRRG